jgi:hypothetical protein
MGVEIWLNKNGHLERDTLSAALNEHGLYNTLTLDDVDSDGDMDILAGNQGLNNQFNTTTREPMEMFYGDFDGNGTVEPVISYYIDGKAWPIYSRDDLVQQIPSYNKKFLYYADYAKADIHAVLGENLASAKRYHASQMASMYFENNNGKFEAHQLPVEAQWYPVYNILSIMNGDFKHIVTSGNQAYARIKFGAYSTGKGDVFEVREFNDSTYFERLAPYHEGVYDGFRLKGDVRNAVVAGNKIIFGINDQRPLVYQFN